LDNVRFYFPKVIFNDARATKTGDKTLIYPDVSYWSAIAKIPNGCLVIASQGMMITSDYFKDNKRRAAQIDLINEPNRERFLTEIKNSDCVMYLRDARWSANDYAYKFLEENLDMKLVEQLGGLGLYEVELKNSNEK